MRSASQWVDRLADVHLTGNLQAELLECGLLYTHYRPTVIHAVRCFIQNERAAAREDRGYYDA